MRYLRMMSNSLVAGLLTTSYILVLVLQLNPTVPLQAARLAPLFATVGLFYALHATVICYVLLVIRQVLAREVFSPAWISVGVLVWLCTLASAAGAALMWGNLYTFFRVLDEPTMEGMVRGALALSMASLLLALLAVARHVVGQRARTAWATALVVLAAASVVVPLASRGRGDSSTLDARPLDATPDVALADRTARVMVIAVDAGSLDFITSATTEGRLPNFGRVLDAGAVMHLATVHPTSAEAVWAAVATGKLPQKNGVRSAGTYRLAARFGNAGGVLQLLPDYCFSHSLVRLGFLVEEWYTAAALRTRPLWGILSTHGMSVGVVGWALTQPAPAVRGYLVSDAYHRLALTPSAVVDSSGVYPALVAEEASLAMEQALADSALVVPDAGSRGVASRHGTPGRTDRIYDRIGRELAAAHPVQVSLTRFQSLDLMGHYFLRYAQPAAFGDVSDEERRSFGTVLERHYAIIDEAIGRALGSLGPDDLLLVVSGFGMEPLGLGKRLMERLVGDPEVSGTHDGAPDGFLLAYGGQVAKGRLTARASLVDVVPTILYFLGLPIGRDMDGYARTDLFQPSFTGEHLITFIPTYDR